MGIIWGALGGLGHGIADSGEAMSRFAMMEEERRQRALEREQLLRERLDSNKELALLRGGGSGGGFHPPAALTPGSLQEEHIAAQTGVDVPTLNAGRSGHKTGDWREFGKLTGTAKDVDSYSLKSGTDMMGSSPDAVLENPEAFTTKTTRTEFTPEHEEAKQKFLEKYARASGGLVYGSAYKSVADGQDKAFETQQKQKIVEGADPTRFSEAQASEKGKRFENTGESGSMNTSTGKPTLNDLGKAKASNERKGAENSGAELRSKNFAALQQERIAIDADLSRIESSIKSERSDQQKGLSKTAKKESDDRIALLEKEREDAKKYKKQVMERLAQFGDNGQGTRPPAGSSGDNKGIVKPSDEPLPPAMAAKLKTGVQTTFANGQVWTLGAGGKPQRVR